MNILLIEPDKTLAAQYSKILDTQNVITLVSDAQEAISAIDDNLPDVIVLELLLGNHNGLEFVYELRSYADSQHIPIILQTYVDHPQFTSDETLMKDLGIVEYLYKPATTLKQLKKAIDRIPAKRQS